MIQVLATSLYSFLPIRSHRAIVVKAGIDSDLHPMAYRMMAATNAIQGLDPGTKEAPGPRSFARGAILEQIAEGMLRVRRPDLLTEQCVGPLDERTWTDGKSDSLDFVMPAAPCELWDAKSDVLMIKSRHLNQFELLLDLADADSMAGFITLDERINLVDWLGGFTGFTHPIYAYVFENFETMATSKPATQVYP